MGLIMKYIKKYLILWLVLGMCYAQLELIFRGETYLPMTFIGGLAGILIGMLGRKPSASKLKMWQMCLLGTLIVLDTEFISGYICNIRLGMMLWDYSGYRYNIDGQVCLKLAAIWFLLIPFALWVNDYLCFKLFDGSKPQSLWHSYKKLLTLR
jgi:uncharacterized membrane protein